MIVHVPERKRPDPSDRLANIIFDAEEALTKVSLFPETNREKAWGDFIHLRSHTKKLIDALNFIDGERKRARAKIAERIESLAGCTEGSAEEIELRVLADLLEPMRNVE